MDSYSFALVLISLPVALCLWGVSQRAALLRKTLPPGPSLLTRILESRSGEPLATKFKRWGHQYGSVLSLMDFVQIGMPMIVISTPKAAIELLEKRGNIYSSRPRNIFAGEVAFRGAKGTLMPMGTKMKRFRTLMSATLSGIASKQFRLIEDPETKLMMMHLLQEKDPAKYRSHIQRTVHSVAFCTAFGQRIGHIDADHLKFFASVETFFFRFALPGSRLVDHFPILSKLPIVSQWLCREALKHGAVEERVLGSFFDSAKMAYAKGNTLLGASWHVMEKREEFGYADWEAASISSAPYVAGVTTTLGTYGAFLLAILLNPGAMYTAQKEIDTVVGSDRMPDFRDFDSLLYIRAMIKETLRWHPFTPFGIPHATTEDDVYEGMFIPAGSTVIANIYALTRDIELFPDPEEFRPERFLDATDPLLKNYNLSFGFGRRICPGQHVATDLLFMLISRILWAFDVKPLKGSPNISEIKAQHAFCGPALPLPYELIPRSDHVRSLIVEQAALAEDDIKAWETFQFYN